MFRKNKKQTETIKEPKERSAFRIVRPSAFHTFPVFRHQGTGRLFYGLTNKREAPLWATSLWHL